jgi:hypothetical protein
MSRLSMNAAGRSVAALVLALGLSGQAHAALLTAGLPDLQTTPVSVQYDSSLGLLTVAGTTGFNLLDAGGSLGNPDAIDAFLLQASIDGAGNLSGGSFSYTAGAAPIFSGTLQAPTFGAEFLAGGQFLNLDFLATVTGEYAGYFALGDTVGLKLNVSLLQAATSFAGDFEGAGTSDTFGQPVPEPASLVLVGIGALALWGARYRSRG